MRTSLRTSVTVLKLVAISTTGSPGSNYSPLASTRALTAGRIGDILVIPKLGPQHQPGALHDKHAGPSATTAWIAPAARAHHHPDDIVAPFLHITGQRGGLNPPRMQR
jgi:hypothetical protein